MRKIALILLFAALPAGLAAQCTSASPLSGVYPGASGPAQYVVVMPEPPSCFNGDMILLAHGYIPVGSPPDAWLSQLALPDGSTLPGLVNKFGFGFAASSFSKDGLAILEGIQDTKGLMNVIPGLGIPVRKYFVAGVSEGAVVAAKSVEDDASYDGGIAACGPIGSFQDEVNYFGDVRVLFDYFFPGVLMTGTPGESAVNIPPALIAGWAAVYEPAVRQAVIAHPLATLQLINTANIPIGLNFGNAADAITSALWYNIFATNDATTTLGGNPFDNIGRVYKGSFRDARLNAMVARFAAQPAAISALTAYETSGHLDNPLVTLHTIFDPVASFRHETLYRAKVKAHDDLSELVQLPALRYGHCNVNGAEAATALLLLIAKAGL